MFRLILGTLALLAITAPPAFAGIMTDPAIGGRFDWSMGGHTVSTSCSTGRGTRSAAVGELTCERPELTRGNLRGQGNPSAGGGAGGSGGSGNPEESELTLAELLQLSEGNVDKPRHHMAKLLAGMEQVGGSGRYGFKLQLFTQPGAVVTPIPPAGLLAGAAALGLWGLRRRAAAAKRSA